MTIQKQMKEGDKFIIIVEEIKEKEQTPKIIKINNTKEIKEELVSCIVNRNGKQERVYSDEFIDQVISVFEKNDSVKIQKKCKRKGARIIVENIEIIPINL